MEYDTMQTDPRYVDIESHSPPREESARSSPVSMGTGSLGTRNFIHYLQWIDFRIKTDLCK